jgi:hypothetical protein
MNISHEKYLTDLHYGNTNKHSIFKFEELFAHPNYKKIIQPELLKFMRDNFSNSEVVLTEENSKKIMNKIDSFSFLSVHELVFSRHKMFFDMADCIALKDDLFDMIKDWDVEDLSKDPYSKEDRTYAINHPTLTSDIGLFQFNKKTKNVESLIRTVKTLSNKKSAVISAPILKLYNVSQDLNLHISSKYKTSSLKKAM